MAVLPPTIYPCNRKLTGLIHILLFLPHHHQESLVENSQSAEPRKRIREGAGSSVPDWLEWNRLVGDIGHQLAPVMVPRGRGMCRERKHSVCEDLQLEKSQPQICAVPDAVGVKDMEGPPAARNGFANVNSGPEKNLRRSSTMKAFSLWVE